MNRRNPLYTMAFSVGISINRYFIEKCNAKKSFWSTFPLICLLPPSLPFHVFCPTSNRHHTPQLFSIFSPKMLPICIWNIFFYNFLSICLMKGRRPVTVSGDWLERMFALKSLNICHPPPLLQPGDHRRRSWLHSSYKSPSIYLYSALY